MKAMYLPVKFVNGSVASTSTFDTIIKQRIIDVLVVSKGERVMRPDYGIGSYNMLYELIDPLIWADFRATALSELNKNVSGVTIKDIKITSGPSAFAVDDATTVNISVFYQIPPSQEASVTLTVSDILNEDTYA